MNADQATITAFLVEFKKLVSTGRDFELIGRSENNPAFLKLGITWTVFISELLGLSFLDYSSGPETDRDQKGSVWIFGKVINNHEMYIKLKIFNVGPENRAKCISFHEVERPLKYPFRI